MKNPRILRISIKLSFIVLLFAIAISSFFGRGSVVFAQALIHTVNLNSSTLTSLGGCTGLNATRMELYCNGDGGRLTDTGFTPVPGQFQLSVMGSSNGSNSASADVYIDSVNGVGGTKIGGVTWTSSTQSAQIVNFNVNSGGSHELKFTISTDNGSSDTYLYSYSLYYVGPIPTPAPPPSPATTGAAITGIYRNLFQEWGQSTTAINNKVNAAYSALFDTNSSSNYTIYYEVGTDMAYVKDIGDSDIRTEGMSYGMMITLQMNDQTKFNKLWKFAKTYMQCPNANFDCGTAGQRHGYFALTLNPTPPYSPKTFNPAPDGEQWYTTALLFAAGRWGNGAGIFNYQNEAQIILNAMLVDNRPNSFHNMFNPPNHLADFLPNNQSSLDTH